MSQQFKTIRNRATMFVSRHPRLTLMLVLLVVLLAVQGSAAAVDVDCATCVEQDGTGSGYGGPDSKD